jgi:hypothetical protein
MLTPMSADFCIAPGGNNSLEVGPASPFVYGLTWGSDDPWSDNAVLRIESEDGTQTHDFQKGDGQTVDDFLVFTFTDVHAGVRYQGSMVDGDQEYPLFGLVELWSVQDPADPCCHLPLPEGGDDDDSSPDSDPGSDDSTSL